jgi:predicted DNA-binding helix-hairpin-helix protein
MQHQWICLSLASALLIGSPLAFAADDAKAAAKPAAAQPAAAPAKTTAPAKKPKTKPVDINSASAEQLKAVPGVDDARAEKIIKNRPYATRAYLVTREVYSQEEYYKVKDYFVAAPPAETKTKANK